jgi:D-alanyl-D-alanine carboxypeptidase
MKFNLSEIKSNYNLVKFFTAYCLVIISLGSFALFFYADKGQISRASEVNSQAASNLPPSPEVLGAATGVSIPLRGAENPATSPQSVQLAELPFDLNNVSVKAVLIYDQKTGQIIAGKNADSRLPIASLTKLMTAYITYIYGNLNDIVAIKAPKSDPVSPSLYPKSGDKIKVSDLFDSMLVGSCNDTSQILADYIANLTKKDFIALMNETAGALGMRDTHFSNPAGFESVYNYSTANDLKKLVDATQKLTAFVSLGKTTKYQFTSEKGILYAVPATNKLIAKYPEIESIKTGYTDNAGGSMISKVTLDGSKAVIIVLGSQDREQDTLELMRQLENAIPK